MLPNNQRTYLSLLRLKACSDRLSLAVLSHSFYDESNSSNLGVFAGERLTGLMVFHVCFDLLSVEFIIDAFTVESCLFVALRINCVNCESLVKHIKRYLPISCAVYLSILD